MLTDNTPEPSMSHFGDTMVIESEWQEGKVKSNGQVKGKK